MKTDPNISSELISISAAVANLPKNTPFHPPKGYFKSFPTQIITTIYLRDDQVDKVDQKLAATMNKEDNGFLVPNGYFEEFGAQLMIKMKGISKNEEGKVIGFFRIKNVLKYAAAACLAGIILFSYFDVRKSEKSQQILSANKTEATSGLSIEGILSYLEETKESAQSDEAELTILETDNLLVDMSQETITQVLTEIPVNDIKNFIDESEIFEINAIN